MPFADKNGFRRSRSIKIHAGKFIPLCRHKFSVKVGFPVTCKLCIEIVKSRKIGETLNEYDAKRLKALFNAKEAARMRLWRKNNPERSNDASRRWDAKNQDLRKIARRAWYHRNRDRINAEARQAHKAKMLRLRPAPVPVEPNKLRPLQEPHVGGEAG